MIDKLYCLRFLGNDLRIAVIAFPIAEGVFVSELDISFLGTLFFTPSDIGADIFGLALCQRTVDGYVELRAFFDAVNALFLKIYVNVHISQHANVFETVDGISCETADRFRDDHVYLAALAHADHFIEFVTVLGACTGNAFVSKDFDELPFRFGIDFFCVVSRLNLITVDLFFLLGGYPAIRRNTLLPVFVLDIFADADGRRNDMNLFLLFHNCAPFLRFVR